MPSIDASGFSYNSLSLYPIIKPIENELEIAIKFRTADMHHSFAIYVPKIVRIEHL